MNFKRFFVIMEYLDSGSGVAVPSDWSGSEQFDKSLPFLPSMDLALPAITKHGKIAMIIKDKNPILVQLDDGTQLFFTIDQYRRISGSPENGRSMTVVFQRHQSDRTRTPSQISACSVA